MTTQEENEVIVSLLKKLEERDNLIDFLRHQISELKEKLGYQHE